MGPNIYITPPGSYTHFHQDGHGTVDSGHTCLSGYNEVIMLRRLPERRKKHALHLLTGVYDGQKEFDPLYHLPHNDDLVRFIVRIDAALLVQMEYTCHKTIE